MNEFQRLKQYMPVVPVGGQAIGIKGTVIQGGTELVIEHIFEHEGRPHLNFPKIHDSFPAWQFESLTKAARKIPA